jgi:hypothetical protein
LRKTSVLRAVGAAAGIFANRWVNGLLTDVVNKTLNGMRCRRRWKGVKPPIYRQIHRLKAGLGGHRNKSPAKMSQI